MVNSMNTKHGNILVIDDDEDVLLAAKMFLKQHFLHVHTEKTPKMIPSLLKNEKYDVILLDMNFTKDVASGVEGFYWLDKILEIKPSAVVVLITAFGDVEMAVHAIKEGATDFIQKPWQNEKLLATINSALNLSISRSEVDSLRSRQKQLSADMDQPFVDIVGKSDPMLKVFHTIKKVAKTDADVLILGENGTGKELAARELHRRSKRKNEVFISVDMGAISETLFESELFGHVKGAFTDAKENRAGRFEIATEGTLFLDEIGNLSLPLQAKLLTVLETRQTIRVGSNTPVQFDIRLICATNLKINEMVINGDFRQDLLYRINTVEIPLPPLREKIEDIPLLVDHFLSIYSKKYQKPLKGINHAALKKLEKYHWPGNVRELSHSIERAVILCDSNILKPEDFLFTASEIQQEGIHIENLNLEEIEKLAIRKTLSKYGGNVSRTAKELGLTRTSLYRRLEKYGL